MPLNESSKIGCVSAKNLSKLDSFALDFRYLCVNMEIKLTDISELKDLLPQVKELYLSSFPVEERREWESIAEILADASSPYRMTAILADGEFGGFITSWNLDGIVYVEHFAVALSMRGGGIGGAAVREFVARSSFPVVLEVELPESGAMACRRIEFYRRNGFTACAEYEYIQPPYSAGLPEVPLMLMHSPTGGVSLDLDEITRQIHRNVYKKF